MLRVDACGTEIEYHRQDCDAFCDQSVVNVTISCVICVSAEPLPKWLDAGLSVAGSDDWHAERPIGRHG